MVPARGSRSAGPHRGPSVPSPRACGREAGTRRLLDQLLMAALHRAVPLEEVYRFAAPVSHDLDLHVSRAQEYFSSRGRHCRTRPRLPCAVWKRRSMSASAGTTRIPFPSPSEPSRSPDSRCGPPGSRLGPVSTTPSLPENRTPACFMAALAWLLSPWCGIDWGEVPRRPGRSPRPSRRSAHSPRENRSPVNRLRPVIRAALMRRTGSR